MTPTPTLNPTEFQILDKDLNTIVVDAKHFPPGVLMNMGGWEVFCTLNNSKRWIAYNGETYNDYEFAKIARACNGKVMVIHEAL